MDKLLRGLLEANGQTTAQKIATAELVKAYRSGTILTGDYSYFPGDLPVCLVAHLDTVPRARVALDCNRSVVQNFYQEPLGADDRAGVYAVCEVIRRLKQAKRGLPSVLLTCGEETGGTGVKRWLADKAWGGQDVLFVELDRAHASDYVHYYGDLPAEVAEYVEQWGFIESQGSYSDVSDIAEGLLVPCVNLSVGYYHQHSAREVLHLDELALTIKRVMSMLKEPLTKLYPLKKVAYNDRLWSFGYYGLELNGYKGNGNGTSKSGTQLTLAGSREEIAESLEELCEYCNRCFPLEELTESEGWLICGDCLEDFALLVCDGCGEPSSEPLNDHLDMLLCDDCIDAFRGRAKEVHHAALSIV